MARSAAIPTLHAAAAVLATVAAVALASAQVTPAVVASVRAAYQREFGLALEHPAVDAAPANVDCRGERHVTTTAYLGTPGGNTTLYSLLLSPDGGVVLRRAQEQVVRPAGVFKVLCVLIRYPATYPTDALKQWEDAQQRINEDHAAFAASRGYAHPVVRFVNTNVSIDGGAEGLAPRNPASIRQQAEGKGIATEPFDFIVAVDINPAESVGGFSLQRERAVYVGNFSRWTRPLESRDWLRIANTAYHHEVAHHWGWQHDWSPSCGGKRLYGAFNAAPVLFGWEDVDGDGIAEVLDQTPYGIRTTGSAPARRSPQRSRVASAFVPAAQTRPPAFE
jgi:hypothetical protein